MTRQAPSGDPAALSPREIEVLALLAQGHTVKSIATLLGLTPGSINERLRDARRKTGASSSRELARLLRDKKFVPREIGVAPAGKPAPFPSPQSFWRRHGALVGGVMMIGIAMLALAVASPPARQNPPAAVAAHQYDLHLTLYRGGQVIARPVLRAAERDVVRASAGGQFDLTVVLLPVAVPGRLEISFAVAIDEQAADRRFSGTVRFDEHGSARVALSKNPADGDYAIEIAADPVAA